MRYSFTVFLLLSVLLLLSYSTASEGTANFSGDIPDAVLPLLDKPVLKWSVLDVERWMNYTVGYSEYSGYLRKNLIDGVTLLEMEPADFESYLPLQSPLHSIKIGAHLKLLQGLCTCRADATDSHLPKDFWSYMKLHPRRTWILGATANFFPRTAMLFTYLLDKELYLDIVGREVPSSEVLTKAQTGSTDVPLRTPSKVKVAAYWISFLVAPDLYMAYQAARFTPSNYLLMPLLIVHFLSRALGEYFLIYLIYEGKAFPPGRSLVQKIRMLYSYSVFTPIIGVVVAFAFPVALQYVVAAVVVVHNIYFLVMSLFLGDTEIGQPVEETERTEEGPVVPGGAEETPSTEAAAAMEEKERLDKLD